MSRKFLVVFLTLILLVTLCIPIPVYAAETPIWIIKTNSKIPSLTGVRLYLDESTPLTVRYFIENPSYYIKLYDGVDNFSYGFLLNVKSGVFKDIVTLDSTTFSGVDESLYDTPIILTDQSKTSAKWTIIDVGADPLPSEPETPTEEPTDPTAPPVVDDEDSIDKSWFDSLGETLLDGIKELFFPIELLEATESLLNAFNDLFGSFGEFDLSPITEFLDSLGSGNVTTYLMKIWDLPIVRELSLAIVLIALIGGLFKFLITV